MQHVNTQDKKFFRQNLIEFYQRHNPDQLKKDGVIDEIIKKYSGKEIQLQKKLNQKYKEKLKIPESFFPSVNNNYNNNKAKSIANATVNNVIKQSPKEQDIELDFYADTFNAAKALQDVNLSSPVANTIPMDNLSKCRSLLPEGHPDYLPPLVRKPVANDVSSESKQLIKRPKPVVPPVLDNIATSLKDGPFSILFKCFTEKRRVTVLIRRISTIRGTCTGYLKAFDKHMNLVLLDVEENYTIPCKHMISTIAPNEETNNDTTVKKKKVGRRKSKRANRVKVEKDDHKKNDSNDNKNNNNSIVTKEEIIKKDNESIMMQEEKKDTSTNSSKVGEDETESILHIKKQKQPTHIEKSRMLKQLLIRGDNIVMIWQTKT